MTKTLHVRLPPELHRKFKAKCAEEERSMDSAAREAIADYVTPLKPPLTVHRLRHEPPDEVAKLLNRSPAEIALD